MTVTGVMCLEMQYMEPFCNVLKFFVILYTGKSIKSKMFNIVVVAVFKAERKAR